MTKRMNAADRNRKLLALGNFLQGDERAVRELKPKMILDLDQFTGNELERLLQLGTRNESTLSIQWDLAMLEKEFGRTLRLILEPKRLTF